MWLPIGCCLGQCSLIEHNLRLNILGCKSFFFVANRVMPCYSKILEFCWVKLIKIPYLFASRFLFSNVFFFSPHYVLDSFIALFVHFFFPLTSIKKEKDMKSIINRLDWIIASTLQLLFYEARAYKQNGSHLIDTFNVARSFRSG